MICDYQTNKVYLAEGIKGYPKVAKRPLRRSFVRNIPADLLRPHKHQPEVFNQRLNLVGLLRIKILRHQQEFLAVPLDALTGRAELLPDEPVGDVDMGLNILRGGVALENEADGHVEVRELRQEMLSEEFQERKQKDSEYIVNNTVNPECIIKILIFYFFT